MSNISNSSFFNSRQIRCEIQVFDFASHLSVQLLKKSACPIRPPKNVFGSYYVLKNIGRVGRDFF